MGDSVPISLNVREALDTSNPISDRAPGTLVEAKDLNSRFWGPKDGSLSLTRAWEGPSSALYRTYINLLGDDAVTESGFLAYSYEDQFRDLGTSWTVDLIFRADSISHASASTQVELLRFGNGAIGPAALTAIQIYIHGSAQASAGKIGVYIQTTSSRDVSSTAVEFTGNTALTFGSGQQYVHHVRLVRDGATATLYLNGVSDGSTSSIVATEPHESAIGSERRVRLWMGRLTHATFGPFKGHGMLAMLRDGAYATAPIEAVIPADPRARNVHFCYLNKKIFDGTTTYVMDLSRYGAHARVDGTGWAAVTGPLTGPPACAPVQGMATFTSRRGRTISMVMAGGVLSRKYVS